MKLENDERFEDLQCDGLRIIQNSKLYTFTSDSVVLANFVSAKKNDIAVEIGAGCGVISILVQAKNDVKKIFAFEIQEKMQNLCKKNINLNDLSQKIELICDDIKNFKKFIQPASVDVVFSNPPYFKQTNFAQSEVKKIAKEEVCLNCVDLIKVTTKLLKDGGSFYCCYPAERVCEFITECQNNNLAVKEMFFTENGKNEVKLAIIKCVKGGKNGVKVFPNLITNEEDGTYLESLHTRFLKK